MRKILAAAVAVLVAGTTLVVGSPPARAVAGTGCDFGTEPGGDAGGRSALDLRSNGWVDVEVDTAGRLFVKATIVTASLSSTPAANVPLGAPGATWELRLE